MMTISINEAQLEPHSHFGLQEKNEDFKQFILNLSRKKKRILLVDDESDPCFSYQTVLEDAGFKCKSYTDSINALQEFRPNHYDLILLDIKMPVQAFYTSKHFQQPLLQDNNNMLPFI